MSLSIRCLGGPTLATILSLALAFPVKAQDRPISSSPTPAKQVDKPAAKTNTRTAAQAVSKKSPKSSASTQPGRRAKSAQSKAAPSKKGASATAAAPGKKSGSTLAKAGAATALVAVGDKALASGSYAGRPELKALAEQLANDHQIPAAWTLAQLGQARQLASVQRLIMPPPAGTAKDWSTYRARFIEPRRVEAGVAFWREHRAWLEQAQARWGVPAELVAGIIGVETYYGRMTGSFRAMDALATLAFDFPPGRRDRSAFFRDELAALARLAWQEKVEVASFKGSYAGALGLPQFMPSSILKWAVDFDGDGHIDLLGNPADVIGSVAHYLASFGWKRDLPTHFQVQPPVDSADRAFLLGPDIVPSFPASQMRARGAVLPATVTDEDGALALVELQNGELAPSYVAGTHNFYVVTRYNWSSYYALAVIELGAAVKNALKGS